ncbi:MAG TPA: T9SS type A sorting domain-containing protein, partial [Niastella sp.]
SDVYFVRYDAAGNFGWAKNIGGSGADNANGITTDAGGNVYVTGTFRGTVDFDAGAGSADLTSFGGHDIFITRYDALGNYSWAKNIGNAGTDATWGIATDQTNSLYITGHFYGTVDFDPGTGDGSLTSSGNSDMYIAKYDLLGNYVWAKSMGGSGDDESRNITVNGNGDVYISGYFAGTADFDPSAAAANVTASGASDYFLARYDASGNYIAAKSMEATTEKNISGIVCDAGGNVFTTGYFFVSSDFDPDAPVYNLVSMFNTNDIFIAKYNLLSVPLPITLLDFDAKPQQSGVHVNWTTTEELNNSYFEVQRSNDGVHFETIGKVNGCGSCQIVMQYSFDDWHPYTATSYYRLKQVDVDGGYSYSKVATVKFFLQTIAELSLYPNPGDGHFLMKIQNTGNRKQIQVSISNASGNLVQQLHPVIVPAENQLTIDLSKQPAGMYLIQVIDNDGTKPTTLKVIKY